MKFGSLRLCLKGIAGLCLLLGITSSVTQAQDAVAGVQSSPLPQHQYRKSGNIDTSPARQVLSLSNALEKVYTKYQLRIAMNEKYAKNIFVPDNLLNNGASAAIASLQKILQSYGLTLNMTGPSQYIITPAEPRPAPVTKPAAKIHVSGNVKDKLGSPLVGVTVKVIKTTVGTTTNDKGFYELDAEPTDTLEFSYIGYQTQQISVRNRLDINIEMLAKQGGLNEVVVVGFGAQKKISLVGAQSTIKPEELKLPVRSLTNALGGRLAGIVAVQRSGEPGYDGSDIWIRGISTFGSSPRGPLIIVDGVPDRSINDLDPEDVESFTVLKDASATAVYGTRGANGVILVNTKTGKPGKPQINIELNQAITKFTQLPKFVDAPTFMRLYNEGLEMRGRTPLYTEERIQQHISGEDPDLYPNVDWFKTLFNQYGQNRRANLNVRGGSEFATYYISAGYYSEVGMLKRDNLQSYNSSIKLDRYNFTTNVDASITKTTKLELGVNGYIINSNYPGIGTGALFNLATQVPPHLIPPQYSNGQWPKIPGGSYPSPYRNLTQSGYATEYRNNIRSNIRVRQQLDFILKGLSATSMFAFDSYSWNNLNRKREVQTYYATGRDSAGNLLTRVVDPGSNVLGFEVSRGGDRRFYTETALNYARKFGDHDVSGLLLYNQSDYIDGDAGDLISSIPFRVRGLSGRATYGYKSRYFAEANFGYNGSENFTPRKRYGLFPSFGAGWVISNEHFFEPLSNVLSYFKVRYTYGLSGNSNTGSRFLFLTRIKNNGDLGYTFGVPGNTTSFWGMEEDQIGSEVSWETGKRQNLGIEIKAFKDELSLIVELFKERRTGILLRQYDIPYSSGYTTDNIPYRNIGITENKGIDITAEYNKTFSKNYWVAFRGNFNFNINKNVYDGLPPWQYPWLNRTGHTIDQRFGYVALGLFSDSADIAKSPRQSGDVRPGDIKYQDLNGDGIINSYDQQAIGYGPVPRIVYGLNFSVGAKGFDLSLFFQGVAMVDFMYSGGHGTNPFYEGPTIGNLYTIATDRWTPDNPNSKPFYPRMSTRQDITTNYYASTWWLKRADYIRLKSAELGYTFGMRKLQKYGLKTLRAYVNGTNLFTISPWKIWDPELGDGRGTAYPNTTTYNFGIRASFK
ncbi:TonB-linked outer membrane protein, SusC/RagA family [Chitinophaga eiseniae]|uniref:TonB-linked outer membrane protein, SusC/RagA family n=1 Tax=Chitinophaga eiseniae TaxID=634771 RepID=A0A1T4T685_9BACT|nr:TonB-dependent receptor [Chitinophaga eiseniae]SKA36060.1 TonB-linked outer membrane protein, SusC/RagA family [Chitinophaga eiseniae]